jgi:hypothetical protein
MGRTGRGRGLAEPEPDHDVIYGRAFSAPKLNVVEFGSTQQADDEYDRVVCISAARCSASSIDIPAVLASAPEQDPSSTSLITQCPAFAVKTAKALPPVMGLCPTAMANPFSHAELLRVVLCPITAARLAVEHAGSGATVEVVGAVVIVA